MKHKVFIKILLLIVIAGFIVSCKKYPDGPLISFRTALHRLYGEYNLTQYTVNGVDSLSLYHDSLGLVFGLAYYNDNYNILSFGGNRSDGKPSSVNCEWQLTDHNKKIMIEYSMWSAGTGPLGNGKNLTWTILKLTNKETKWQVTYNGKEYVIDLVKYSGPI